MQKKVLTMQMQLIKLEDQILLVALKSLLRFRTLIKLLEAVVEKAYLSSASFSLQVKLSYSLKRFLGLKVLLKIAQSSTFRNQAKLVALEGRTVSPIAAFPTVGRVVSATAQVSQTTHQALMRSQLRAAKAIACLARRVEVLEASLVAATVAVVVAIRASL